MNLRLPGVLQRIGLAYFIVASLETVLMKPQGSFQVEKCIVTAHNDNEMRQTETLVTDPSIH